MRVFQIQEEVLAVVQGDRSIQDYSLNLEKLWAELDHFSQGLCCSDPSCKKEEFITQMRTMQFLAQLNSAFDQRRSVLLAQTKISSLDEAIAAMMQEESRMVIHAEPSGPPGARSALAASSSGMTGAKRETRRCYNCGETSHLIKACPRTPRERDAGGRGQIANRERGRGGRRGGRGGNRANLMVVEEEEEAVVGLSDEELIMEIVRRRQKGASEEKSAVDDASTTDNFASVAYSAKGDLPREGDEQGTWD